MTCAESDCNKGIDFQCQFCEGNYCKFHIKNHKLCEDIFK